MTAEKVVTALLDAEINPQDFLAKMPDLYVRYEYIPGMSPHTFEVKRWEKGSYYYIGEIAQNMKEGFWHAYKVAPVGRNLSYIVMKPELRDSRKQASEDLWNLYQNQVNY